MKIEALKGVFKIEDSEGKIVICKVSKNKMKFPKGVNPPEYIMDEIEHFLENSGMLICNNIECVNAIITNRDGLDSKGYILCKHPKGVSFNVSKGLIKCKQCSNGYFIKNLCKLNLK